MVIAIVDDNKTDQAQNLQYMMQAFNEANIPVVKLELFSDGESFLDSWKLGSYDLIILDIVMNEMSGIDVAREIRRQNKDVRIVFCSSSNEYAAESYNLNASYYMKKPITLESINEMITRLNISDFELRRFIILPNDQRLILRNMIYSEYSNHLITIYQKNGDPIKVWLSQSEFLNLLEPYHYFLACNKGNIINMYAVTAGNKDTFTLCNGHCIPISRRKRKEISEKYQNFLFNSIRDDL